MTTKT